MFDEVLFSTAGLLDYRIFLDRGRISLDVEALDETEFDTEGLKARLMGPALYGGGAGAGGKPVAVRRAARALLREEAHPCAGGVMGEILHETESLCPVCLKKIPRAL